MTDSNNNPPVSPPAENSRVFDAFSPKEVVLRARRVILFVLSRWATILIVAVLCGVAGAAYSFLKKPTYSAELTFALDEGAAQSSKSELPQLGEQLGLGQVMDAGGVFSSMTNILELMQSRLLIERTMRSSVLVDSKSLLFANFFLDSLHYREKWMKGSPYYHIDFQSGKKDKKEGLFENEIMRTIYETLIGKHIKIDKKGKGTIISATCVTENELFSKYFLEAWIGEVTRYYIDTRTRRAKINVEFLQHRTDSMQDALNSALFTRAAFTDAHTNPNRQITSVSGEKHQTDVQILKATYTDLVRSLEAARTTLMRETPLIQYLDLPILPLKMSKPSLVTYFLVFFAVGGAVATGVLLLRKGYRHILGS